MQKANAVKRIVAEMTLVRMCDEALDSSTEALLSRIALLEERIATGGAVKLSSPVPPAPVQADVPVTATEKRAQTEERIAPVSGAPTFSTSAKAAKTPQQPKQESAEPVERRVLRPMRNWMEVVERISRSAPMDASFVKAARAFTLENGTVVVRFDTDFGLQMMEKSDARDRLRAALSAVLRREVGDRMLVMEVAGKTEKPSVIDEILEASEE